MYVLPRMHVCRLHHVWRCTAKTPKACKRSFNGDSWLNKKEQKPQQDPAAVGNHTRYGPDLNLQKGLAPACSMDTCALSLVGHPWYCRLSTWADQQRGLQMKSKDQQKPAQLSS